MEIINVSLSQRAGHLNTHFYNAQENSLNNVFLNPVADPISRSVTYSPRLILWDMANGFGSLDTIETYDESLARKSAKLYEEQGIETWNDTVSRLEKVQITSSKPEKSQYQRNLDSQKPLPCLDISSTRFWSDYNRLIYSPLGFISLPNWEIDDAHSRGQLRHQGSNANFDTYDAGLDAWATARYDVDHLDTYFRPFLEQCDNFQGINMSTEFDSGWAAVASNLAQLLRDEYLSKKSLFVWGMNGFCKSKLHMLESNARSLASLVDSSSLVLPMMIPDNLPEGVSRDLGGSYWLASGLDSLPYNTVMSSMTAMTMSDLELSLSTGSNRNIVSVGSAVGTNDSFQDSSFWNLCYGPNMSTKKVFSKSLVLAKSQAAEMDSNIVIEKYGEFDKLRDQGVSSRFLTSFTNKSSFSLPDTFPVQYIPITNQQSVTASLTISGEQRAVILDYSKKLHSILKKNSQKEEVCDQLASIAQNYEWGFEEDDDDFFDD